jgi:hypothetical protein
MHAYIHQVRALAAAIFCSKRALVKEDTADTATDDDPALLLVEATRCFRDGRLDTPEALCLQGLHGCAGWTEGWQDKPHATLLSEPPLLPEVAGLLSLLLSVWIRQQRYPQALAACKRLISAQNTAATNGMESALIWGQLSRIACQVGDTSTAAEAVSSAMAAADGMVPAASTPALQAKRGTNSGGRGIVAPGMCKCFRFVVKTYGCS